MQISDVQSQPLLLSVSIDAKKSLPLSSNSKLSRVINREKTKKSFHDLCFCRHCEIILSGLAAFTMHSFKNHRLVSLQQQPAEPTAAAPCYGLYGLQCLICDDDLCGTTDLEAHLVKDSNSFDFKMCHLCSFSASAWIDYQKHMQSEHQDHENTLCDLCSRDGVFSSFCETCQICVESHDILLIHKLEHKIATSAKLTQITLTLSECNLRCIVCQSEYSLALQFHEHLSSHLKAILPEFHERNLQEDTNEKLKCDRCGFVAITKLELTTHKRSNHKTSKTSDLNAAKTHQCDVCLKTCKTASGLRSHFRRFHGKNFFTCDICKRQFCSKFEVREHILTEHMHVKLFVCNVCGKVSKSRSLHRVHNETHAKKKYLCNLCGKEFSQSAGLCIHVRNAHSENKSFPCRFCGKVFSRSVSRYTHEYAHKNPEALTCHICKHTFTQRSALNTHNKSRHPELFKNQVKQYVCAECGKAYPVKQYLLNHMVRA